MKSSIVDKKKKNPRSEYKKQCVFVYCGCCKGRLMSPDTLIVLLCLCGKQECRIKGRRQRCTAELVQARGRERTGPNSRGRKAHSDLEQ